MQPTLTALTLGDPAPTFSLPSADGRTYTLDDFVGKPALVVIFLANHCPYVGAWEDRVVAAARQYAERDVAFVGVSSNDVAKFPQDGPAEMAKRGYPFPYLHDETQSVAQEFGATRTPEVFVFDAERRLRYHGAVDSDWEEAEAVEPYLRNALDALLNGEPIALPETKPVGCSLKLREGP